MNTISIAPIATARTFNMTSEQKAAFINAQTQMMVVEMKMMEAENQERMENGYSVAHGPNEWRQFMYNWSIILGYNALILFFED